MKNRFLLLISSFLAILLLINSCTKNELDNNIKTDVQDNVDLRSFQQDEVIDAMAKAVALAQKDSDFRRFIRTYA